MNIATGLPAAAASVASRNAICSSSMCTSCTLNSPHAVMAQLRWSHWHFYGHLAALIVAISALPAQLFYLVTASKSITTKAAGHPQNPGTQSVYPVSACCRPACASEQAGVGGERA